MIRARCRGPDPERPMPDGDAKCRSVPFGLVRAPGRVSFRVGIAAWNRPGL